MTARTNSSARRARSRRFAGSICWIAVFASLGAAPGKKDKAETPWAFRPVQRPEVPRVLGDVRNPIDAFLLESLGELELKPVPETDKRTLIRRLSFDLIGLPPSPEEVDAFVGDDRVDAYERLVDRLLASPHYGERWGRHWLDLVRFAETRGYERDDPNPDAWRYRDYVIRSLNEDKPYDRFVLEQIAGDEIPGATVETRIATGLHRLGLYDDEPADKVMDRFDQLDDLIKTVGTTMLGMTVHCARCHDHKFDPIPQADYYRLLAIFEPSRWDEVNLVSESEVKRFDQLLAGVNRQVARHRGEIASIRETAKPAIVARKLRRLDDATLLAFATPDERRTADQKKLVRDAEAKIKATDAELDQALTAADRTRIAAIEHQIGLLNETRPSPLPHAPAITDKGATAKPTHLMIRGDARKPGIEVQPGFLSAVVATLPTIAPPSGGKTTGRRLALARWIVDPSNPLTARVMVNRLWQHHYGQGIVATPSDFGAMGEEPSHPKLLDWLASEFAARGWSLKAMHKLMVTTAAYRRSDVWDDKAGEADPGNTLLWRMVPRRLEAEPARDSALFVDGSINLDIGGPSVFPPIDPGALATQSRPGNGWKTSDEHASNRRSVYVYVKRTLPLPELEVLDAADNADPCPRRAVTTTAPQALTLLNSAFWNRRAAIFAGRLRGEAGSDRAKQIDRAFRLAFGRSPNEAERASSLEFLNRQTALVAKRANPIDRRDPELEALQEFCLVILNTNEFITVD